MNPWPPSEPEGLYYQLQRIRSVELKICDIYATDCIKSPVHLSLGQESVPVAVCQSLNKGDIVFGTYRSHALYLAKGGSLKHMMAELYGKQDGCGHGKAGSMHLIDLSVGMMGTSAVVGTTLPNAIGYAYALKMQGKPTMVTCFIGDGATEEGSFFESINFSVLKDLPILIVCENNGYAIHSRIETRQSNVNIHEKVEAFGMPAYKQESNDFSSLIMLSEQLIAECRQGNGPQFIECATYRDIQHVGPNHDYALGYRQESEAHQWRENDPINTLIKKISMESKADIDAFIEREIQEAINFAEKSEFPEPACLMNDVYG